MRNKFPVVALSMICSVGMLAIPGMAEASGGHGRHHGRHKHHHDHHVDHYYYVPPPPPVYHHDHHVIHHYEPAYYVAPYVVNPFGNGLHFSLDFSRQF